jgi:hypothetical protein
VIEQRGSSGWRRVGVLHANGAGIFTSVVKASGKGPLRAQVSGATSLPYSLVEPPDRAYPPFGAPLKNPPTKQSQRLAAAAAQYVEVAPAAGGAGSGSESQQASGTTRSASGRSALGAVAQAIADGAGRGSALFAFLAAVTLALGVAALRRHP